MVKSFKEKSQDYGWKYDAVVGSGEGEISVEKRDSGDMGMLKYSMNTSATMWNLRPGDGFLGYTGPQTQDLINLTR